MGPTPRHVTSKEKSSNIKRPSPHHRLQSWKQDQVNTQSGSSIAFILPHNSPVWPPPGQLPIILGLCKRGGTAAPLAAAFAARHAVRRLLVAAMIRLRT